MKLLPLCLNSVIAITVKIDRSPLKKQPVSFNSLLHSLSLFNALHFLHKRTDNCDVSAGNSSLLRRLDLGSRVWSWLSISYYAAEKSSHSLFIFYIRWYLYQILSGLLNCITGQVLLFQSVSAPHSQIFLSWGVIYTVHTLNIEERTFVVTLFKSIGSL